MPLIMPRSMKPLPGQKSNVYFEPIFCKFLMKFGLKGNRKVLSGFNVMIFTKYSVMLTIVVTYF